MYLNNIKHVFYKKVVSKIEKWEDGTLSDSLSEELIIKLLSKYVPVVNEIGNIQKKDLILGYALCTNNFKVAQYLIKQGSKLLLNKEF